MNTKERLFGNLTDLAKAGALPRSHCSVRFMSLLRPLVVAGVVAEKRSGAGRQIVIEDIAAFKAFIQNIFPMENVGVRSASRVAGVRRFRDSKTYRADGVDVLRARAFSSGTLRKNGDCVDVHGATANHGVFSFRLSAAYTLHGCVAVVENPTIFDLFEQLELAIPLVIYGQGRISTRVLDWLADQHDQDFSLLHLPDYDPVGLTEFARIRNRLGSHARLYLPENLDDLFRRFANPELVRKVRSQRLLARLHTSRLKEVQAVVKLIDFHGAGLEQEVLVRS